MHEERIIERNKTNKGQHSREDRRKRVRKRVHGKFPHKSRLKTDG
jgi:hypothetical protein